MTASHWSHDGAGGYTNTSIYCWQCYSERGGRRNSDYNQSIETPYGRIPLHRLQRCATVDKQADHVDGSV